MKPDALRTLTLMLFVLLGFLSWPFSWQTVAIGCWVLGVVYALATNPRRWL